MYKDKFIEDINIEQDMFKVMNTQGVVVQVVSKGGKWRYKGAKGFYGRKSDNESDVAKKFKEDHLTDGTISFISKPMERKFRTIETKARNKIRDCAIGYDGSYVPIALYPEVMEHLESCKEEFEVTKKFIVSQASNLIEDFKKKALASSEWMDEDERKKELNKLFSKIPNKEKLEKEMSFDIRVSTFLTMENLDLLPEDIQKKIKESKEQSSDDVIKESITDILNISMASLSSVINSGRKNDGNPASKSIAGLKRQSQRVGQKNIFGNVRIVEIKKMIDTASHFTGDELVEECERILASVYNYANELGIEHEIDMGNCPFTEGELIDVYEMYNQ